MIRVLTFTNLYPNPVRPHLGVFVEHRMRHVVATGEVDLRVVAPVPWFPLRLQMFGDYAGYAEVPHQDARHAIPIEHPRYLVIPKVGMRYTPGAMVRSGRKVLQRLRRARDFDVIDAHYLYPDGVAAHRLAQEFDKPFVMTARGSDVNLIPHQSDYAKQCILDATRAASCVITVSDGLRRALTELGAPADKIRVIRNGVDRDLFRPPAEEAPRERKRLASVGNLIEHKGHHLVIDALRELPDTELVIAGRGPKREWLEQQAAEAGVADRVTFAGAVDQSQLCELYGSSDALVLASSREGLPNVVLEAIACGTPAIATNTGGIPEAIREPDGGRLLRDRTSAAIVDAVRDVFAHPLDRSAVRASIDAFDWGRCAAEVVEVLREATARE